jgi:hypothetical protein
MYGLITRVELRQNCGIDLTVAGYSNLGRALNHFVNRLKANRISDGTSISLRESLNIKKPGAKIRGLLVKKRKKPFDLEEQQTCKTFFRITGIEYVGNELFSKICSIWNVSGFTNRQKSFYFKFFNNILGLNTRTSHFAVNANRGCFFVLKTPLLLIRTKLLFTYFIAVVPHGLISALLLGLVSRKWKTFRNQKKKNYGF